MNLCLVEMVFVRPSGARREVLLRKRLRELPGGQTHEVHQAPNLNNKKKKKKSILNVHHSTYLEFHTSHYLKKLYIYVYFDGGSSCISGKDGGGFQRNMTEGDDGQLLGDFHW